MKYFGLTPMSVVFRMVSPEKSIRVTMPWLVGVGFEMATAYLVGWPAGPTGLIALTTGPVLVAAGGEEACRERGGSEGCDSAACVGCWRSM